MLKGVVQDKINSETKIKQRPILANIFKRVSVKNEKIELKALCLFKFKQLNAIRPDFDKIKLEIAGMDIPIKFVHKKGLRFIKNYYLNIYKFEFPIKDILAFDIQNKLIIIYEGNEGPIKYNIFDIRTGKNRNSKIIIRDKTSIYFRQTPKNTTYLTIRETNDYDTIMGKFKLFIAYIISKLYMFNHIILLYEKESSRYEESASVLYEKLIDLGYKNCYFILNKDNPKLGNLDFKYRKNIIYKDTMKHLIYFFCCKKFIGTESLAHAIKLRVANKKVIKKTENKNLIYVFLQHGVMYMISLDADNRTAFRNNDNFKVYKVVVSSKLEAEHFIELGEFEEKNFYITGLAKFDRSTKNTDADKIIIIPTWRRWEVNQARIDFSRN